jgi:hypothetical protein
METSALAQSASERYPQAAGPIHTIFVLTVLGGWTFWGKALADQLRAAANPNRVRFYVLTLFFEWFLFVLVVAGVRRSGAPILVVLGDRWDSVRQVLRDIGIAAAFWLVSSGLLLILGRLLRIRLAGSKYGLHTPARRRRNNTVARALGHGGYLRGDDLSGLPAAAVHGPD